jgi:hypothetical protein
MIPNEIVLVKYYNTASSYSEWPQTPCFIVEEETLSYQHTIIEDFGFGFTTESNSYILVYNISGDIYQSSTRYGDFYQVSLISTKIYEKYFY